MRRVPVQNTFHWYARREMRHRIDRFRLGGSASLSLSSVLFSLLLPVSNNVCQNLVYVTRQKLTLSMKYGFSESLFGVSL